MVVVARTATPLGVGAQRGTAARYAKLAGADYASYPSTADRNIPKTVESPGLFDLERGAGV